MKTINYELAKKLYDAGVIIPSKKFKKKKGSIVWTDIYGNEIKFPAPNVEELIEFLKIHIRSITYLSRWSIILWKTSDSFEGDTIFECLEATLEHLLDNGYIGNQNF